MVRDHAGDPSIKAVLAAGAVLEPEHVAAEVVAALRAKKFLVLPHREVAQYEVARATDRTAGWARWASCGAGSAASSYRRRKICRRLE